MPLDESNLVDRARDGELSQEEVDELVMLLRERPDHPATYTRLNALGWLMSPTHAVVVVPFLSREDDPMLCGLAVQILVGSYGLGHEFADDVLDFARGVEWDDDNDVRRIALSRAGELARDEVRRADMIAVLLAAIEDDDQYLVREAAYHAILRALGRHWREMPGAGRVDDGAVAIDPTVVAWAKALARDDAP